MARHAADSSSAGADDWDMTEDEEDYEDYVKVRAPCWAAQG